MEPALDERGDRSFEFLYTVWAQPQWSPLSTSGATYDLTPANIQAAKAAMEPALDERGDLVGRHQAGTILSPQWSPLSTSGATRERPTKEAGS